MKSIANLDEGQLAQLLGVCQQTARKVKHILAAPNVVRTTTKINRNTADRVASVLRFEVPDAHVL